MGHKMSPTGGIPSVPLRYSIKVFLQRQWRTLNAPGYEAYRYAFMGGAALLSWYYAYRCLTNTVDETSSFVRQTLFNLKLDPRIPGLVGEPFRLVSGSLVSDTNMIQGSADLLFRIEGDQGVATVHACGRREGWVWVTTYLSVSPSTGPTLILEDASSPTQ